MVEYKIPIVFEGMLKNAQQIADNIMKGMQATATTTMPKAVGGVSDMAKAMSDGFNKMLIKLGIIATIWEAFDVFLRPIMQLFKLILVLLFMPMMPLVKQMLLSLKDVAANVKTAQAGAGGEGMPAFMAGVGALLASPTIWGLIGAILAAAFLANLVVGLGSLTLGGALVASLTLGVLWANAVWSKEDLQTKLETVFIVGIAAAIVTLIAGGTALTAVFVGLLTVSVGLGLLFIIGAGDMIANGVNLKNAIDLLIVAAAAGAGIGALTGIGAGGAAMAAGAGYGGIILLTLAVGIIIGSWFVHTGAGDWLATAIQTVKDFFGGEKSTIEVTPIEQNFVNLNSQIGTTNTTYATLLSDVTAGNSTWVSMRDVSVASIGDIITELGRIPTDITTTHHIVTVYESEGGPND